jgi:hypothetical protein
LARASVSDRVFLSVAVGALHADLFEFRIEGLSWRLILGWVRQRPLVLEHLAEITAIDPAATGRALVLRRVGAGALGTDTRSVLLRTQRSVGRSPGRFAFFPALWRLGGRHLRAEDRALDPSPAYRAETPIRKYAFT